MKAATAKQRAFILTLLAGFGRDADAGWQWLIDACQRQHDAAEAAGQPLHHATYVEQLLRLHKAGGRLGPLAQTDWQTARLAITVLLRLQRERAADYQDGDGGEYERWLVDILAAEAPPNREAPANRKAPARAARAGGMGNPCPGAA